MRKLFVKGSIALLSVMLVFTFAACPEDSPSKKPPVTSGSAELQASFDAVVTADDGDEAATSGTLGSVITAAEWATATNKDALTTTQKAGVLDFTAKNYTSAIPAKFEVTAKDGTPTVTFAVATDTAKPTNFAAISVTSDDLHTGDTIYFKVVDGSKTNYYCATVAGIGSGASQSVTYSAAQLNSTLLTWPSGGNTYRNAILASVVPAVMELPSSLMTGTITFTLNGANRFQTISWAKVTSGVPAETAFTAFTLGATGNGFTATVSTSGLVNDELLFVKVIAQDPTAVMYYGYKISVGNIARISSITFDDKTPSLGTPGATWQTVVSNGLLEYGDKLPSGGVAVVATAEDSGVITYAVTANSTATPTFAALPSTGKLILSSDGYVYIRVVSVSAAVTAIYKLQVVSQNSVVLLYGQPEIKLPASPTLDTEPELDPLWATIPWDFDINRTNTQVTTNARFNRTVDGLRSETGYGHTEGKAKAFWDDGGVYVYSEMTFHDYYDTLTSTDVKVKSTVLATGSTSDTYQYDDIEIFTNERLQTYSSGNYGIQYRVNPVSDGAVGNTNSVITGTDAGALPNALQKLRNSEKYYSWIRKEAGKEVGYSVLVYIPWMAKGNANATAVYNTDGTVKTNGNDDGPKIGMEFQLNAMVTGGTRDAILTWNGIDFQAYQTVTGFGIVQMVTGDLTARGIVRGAKDATMVTVTFNKNGGDTEANPTTAQTEQGTMVTLPAPPTKDGWKFLGWATTNNAEEPDFTAATRVSASLTVYAVWTQNIVITDIPLPGTVTFGSNHQYGSGYQYTQALTTIAPNLARGDKFRISGVYTVNRDVPGDIEIGIINPSPPSYWNALTTPVKFTGPSEVGTEYTFDIVFEITADVPATGVNSMYMQTEAEPQADFAALVLTINPLPPPYTQIPLNGPVLLAENQYGTGYQAMQSINSVAPNIVVGDVFRISGTFTVSRAVAGNVEVGIVNNSSAMSYWGQLASPDKFLGPLEVGTSYPFDITYTITTLPLNNSNQLYLQTEGEYTRPTNGTHAPDAIDPLTITFTPSP